MAKLEELEVYRRTMELGECVWALVQGWSFPEEDTVGRQRVKAADSIASIIAEGYGRYHFKENRPFCYYSRGSAFETLTWIAKAKNRNLLGESEFSDLKGELDAFTMKLNRYIRTIGPPDKR